MKPTELTNIQAPLFSLEESDSYYMVALDLPSLPSEAEIFTDKRELVVEGKENQLFFRCRPQGQAIRASYQDGRLWLLLPKMVAFPLAV